MSDFEYRIEREADCWLIVRGRDESRHVMGSFDTQQAAIDKQNASELRLPIWGSLLVLAASAVVILLRWTRGLSKREENTRGFEVLPAEDLLPQMKTDERR